MLSLNKQYSTLVKTACVAINGINLELHINKTFWDTLTDLQQVAILTHELMHITSKHLEMDRYFDQKEIYNIATDCEINQRIKNLPDGCITLQYVSTLVGEKLPANAGAKFYYDKLKNVDKQKNKKDQANGLKQPIDDHSTWKNNLTPAEVELISQQIDSILKNTAEQVIKNKGTIPGELLNCIEKLRNPKKQVFNWKAYFRRLLGYVRDDELRKTRKKASIRFPESSGIKHKRKSNILVAVDTSGSVSNSELQDFFNEIDYIANAGTNIDICQFDSKINKIVRYKKRTDIEITGRGGTDFIPCVDYYNIHCGYYQSLVIFTDGYSEIDRIKNKNIIWVISSNGAKQNYPGKVIYIPKNNE